MVLEHTVAPEQQPVVLVLLVLLVDRTQVHAVCAMLDNTVEQALQVAVFVTREHIVLKDLAVAMSAVLEHSVALEQAAARIVPQER